MSGSCGGAGEGQGGTQGGASWMNRGVCRVCGKNLALTSSGRIPRHLAQDKAARTVEAVDLIGFERDGETAMTASDLRERQHAKTARILAAIDQVLEETDNNKEEE